MAKAGLTMTFHLASVANRACLLTLVALFTGSIARAQNADAQAPAPKADAKPAAPTDPKAAPAKPKAAPKVNPFQGFGKAVSIPELPQSATASAEPVLDPIEVGPCKADAVTPVSARLKGGSTIFRGGKQSFTLEPASAAAPGEWEFKYASGTMTTVIAKLIAQDGKLSFQWTEAGAKQVATSRLLCNCAVELSAGGFQHVFNLRQPINGPPLPISIDKGGGTARWVFDHVPDIKQVFIEATRFDGLRRRAVDVPEPVCPGEDLTVWTGPREDNQFLGLKFESSPMAKGLKMTVSVELKSEAADRSVPYNKKEMSRFQQQLDQERNMLNRKLQEVSQAKVPDKKQQEEFKAKLKQEVDLRTKRLGQLELLNKYVTDVQGAVAIHFRVYYQADDQKVDLFIAGDPPPRPVPQRKAPPPKVEEVKK